MLRLTFSSKVDWGFYIISVAKTASEKIGALIRSVKFLCPDLALYLYKSIRWPCMEYCCHVWDGAPSCYLKLLDKLQKRIYRTVGPSLGASVGPSVHCRNIASWTAEVFSISITFSVQNSPQQSANAEAFAEAYLCFLVSASEKKKMIKCQGN